ncbi:leucyl aminopeptidase [bacterium]|nr:leucyl aminopeptidase [bacterium]
MLTIRIKKDLKQLESDLLCIFSFEGSKQPEKLDLLDAKLKKKVLDAVKTFGFKSKIKEILLLEGSSKFKRLLLIGLGKKNKLTNDKVRLVSHLMIKQANALKVASVVAPVPGMDKYGNEAIEGALLADYQFKGLYQKEDKDKRHTLKTFTLLQKSPIAQKSVDELLTVFDAVQLAKDLVNLPSNIVTPTYLEKTAKEIVNGQKNVSIEVLSETDAEKKKMGAFLAVARGSKEPAKMIVMTYTGNPKDKNIYGVVGKGITFDSGGISLKPSAGMSLMKTDMAGSAAALGAFKAVCSLGLEVNLLVVIAATENMPGGEAYRPGDIITASNGKTIEVVNTDAEGRLVLADALVYAQSLGANKIIDMATLTGACIVAFGNIHTGLMGNNIDWSSRYLESSRQTGEKTWELPMDEEYDELIKSDICDMVNASEARKAGTIMGGKFLEQFIEKKTSWIHLDIAGTSYMDSAMGYLDKHATGTPIRTIVNLLKSEITSRSKK